MGCNCEKRQDDRREEVFGLLEALNLRAIGEQVSAIPETMASARRYLAKAERAERLGLGADVSILYRQAAERDRDQAIRQVRSVVIRLDERTGRDDWADFVDRTRREFLDTEGPAVLDEARSRFRFAVLEMDGVSADGAAEIVPVWEESLDRLREDGLNGVARLLKERLERAVEVLRSPRMGSESASPQTVGQLICIGIASALAATMMVACWFGCFTCGGYAIIIWLAAAIALCLAMAI
jgi:hypothetical protein